MMSNLPQYKGRLTPSQIADGMNVASRNALRLALDADFLRKGECYPSAVALAILSIEESGKLMALRRLAVATTDDEVKATWKEYRTHTSKNGAWIVPALIVGGARTLEDFRPALTPGAAHTYDLENAKQLALYSDCLQGPKWSEPKVAVSKSLADQLVGVALILAKDSPVDAVELELWIEHLGPVWNTSFGAMKRGLSDWNRAIQALGRPGYEDIDKFLGFTD